MTGLTKAEQARVDLAMEGQYIERPTDAEKAEIERRWFAAGRSNRDLGRIQGWTRKVEPVMWKEPKKPRESYEYEGAFGLLPGAWADEAACRTGNADDWHPAGDAAEAARATARALEICRRCSVALQCLQFALNAETRHAQGIWGGTTADQRRQLLKRARRAA